jgi:NAD+ kinase
MIPLDALPVADMTAECGTRRGIPSPLSRNRPMRIFVLGNVNRAGVKEEAERLLPFLREHCEVAVFDLCQEHTLEQENVDLALVLGGDGAILHAAHQMGYRQHPVLGVNLGRLGFLADLHPDELRTCFPAVVRGEFRVTQHLMFECAIETPRERRTLLGLNEVVFRAGPPFHLIEVEVSVKGETVSLFSGDGLILSTPIGSTAQSLSAGGPILSQELPAFVLTPICPHTLTARPIVDSADQVYTIKLGARAAGAMLVVDGHETVPLTPHDRVTVRRAPVAFQLIKVAGHSYYQTLRDKLSWGVPPNYRSEPGRKP